MERFLKLREFRISSTSEYVWQDCILALHFQDAI